MRSIIIVPSIHGKLDAKHTVSPQEIDECFDNMCGVNLIDDREEHRTDPPTLWFIAHTRTGRELKIVYIYRNGNIVIKTAYEPNEDEIRIYDHEGK